MKQIFSEITEFRAELVGWFKRQGRPLPWRGTSDPYAILVSELMLQQTQVSTVLAYYQRWFERFPTLRDLAHAERIRGPPRLARTRLLQAGSQSCTNARRSFSSIGTKSFRPPWTN